MPSDDPKLLGDDGDLTILASLEPSAPTTPIDIPLFIKEARKGDGMRYFEHACPSQYRDFDKGHPDIVKNSAQVDAVLAYQFSPKGMLLTGPTGKGKTRSCWQLLRRLYAEDGIECRWWHAMDFFTELQDQVKFGRDDAKGWVSDLAWRKIVFIDDWGQEANLKSRESWAEGWFFRFVDYRIERGLPLIITTNLTAKDIARREGDVRGDPMLRRLLEMCEVVKFV
ncbi:MAG: ATP-binding protein [Anaerolineales bacterium]|nr:ATP-binding protein [Anaerolineales bacterium]